MVYENKDCCKEHMHILISIYSLDINSLVIMLNESSILFSLFISYWSVWSGEF